MNPPISNHLFMGLFTHPTGGNKLMREAHGRMGMTHTAPRAGHTVEPGQPIQVQSDTTPGPPKSPFSAIAPKKFKGYGGKVFG